MDASLRIVCLVALLLVGCNGSDNSNFPPVEQNDDSLTTLEGRLMFSHIDGEARVIDLSTGNVSTVPGVQEFGDPSGREYASMWKAYAHAQPFSGDRFVLTVESCKFDENDNSQYYTLDHCLALHEADGTELAVRKFYGLQNEIRGSAVLSFDGDYIAAIVNDKTIVIYDNQLNEISRFTSSRSTLKGVVWRPDNGLLYYDNDEIFSTTPLNTQGTRILDLDREYGEDLGTLKVSPDGETLAFEFAGELYLMNLSTNEIRLLPVVEELRLISCDLTSWSPDGQSLMIYAKGTGLVINASNASILGENLVIPTNFGLPGADGKTVLEYTQVMAKTTVWQDGDTNTNAKLEVLSESRTAYWLR